MQVLKDDVRNSIHQAALAEFYEKGFKDASMRSIAEKSGMTVGNLYRYFANKEDLFYAVISPAYHKVTDLTQEKFVEMGGLDDIQKVMGYIANQIVMINREHRRELLILMDGCVGTKFEHAAEEIISLVENKLKRHVFPSLREKGAVIRDEFLAHVLAISQVEGIKAILKHYEDESKIKDLIQQYMHYHFQDIQNRLI
ncbi:AcrR family transcriptional regulator [Anaerosolibacter carboniphilus]|uniref:AcrR family transcriptional regulator n=1 Tax=Anaerosolibacter carboniphilus TaxID=1417629 RepID=A0A841KZH0_9FIRM|nr:TetR/AcrR family transcriptional regulator [Anaerosolibacter carboniphilus]MBB6218757.1 AcrR family transcriptional regulator [Anaerosolibacter carboniphilus]